MPRPRTVDPAFISSLKVDPEDEHLLTAYNWRPHVTKTSGPYAGASVKIAGKWEWLLLHRVITKAPPRTPVEHLNGDPLDNRRSNLLVSNQSSNLLRAYPKGGVYQRGNVWVAQMGGKYLGCFKTKEEAYKFRDDERERRLG